MSPDMHNPADEGGAERDMLGGCSQRSVTTFSNHRQACLALLTSGTTLTRQAGQFLGGEAVSPAPLSEKQLAWLGKLLERAGLPPLATGGENG
jgi:hypothetical protein